MSAWVWFGKFGPSLRILGRGLAVLWYFRTVGLCLLLWFWGFTTDLLQIGSRLLGTVSFLTQIVMNDS